MGTTYLFRCRGCDYSGHFADGSGMSMESVAPMLCDRCRRVVTAVVSPPRDVETLEPLTPSAPLGQCEVCGSDELTAWGSFDSDADEPDPGPCPRCGGDIRLKVDSLWD